MVLRRQNSRKQQNAVCLSRPSGPEAPCVSFQVLCSTSTLALGVNLPAHLVVVKSTRRWSADDTEVAGYKEYDTATCLQMIGRCAARCHNASLCADGWCSSQHGRLVQDFYDRANHVASVSARVQAHLLAVQGGSSAV